MNPFLIFLILVGFTSMVAMNIVYAQCAPEPSNTHVPCYDNHMILVKPHEAKIENIDGQLFRTIGPFNLQRESDDRILLDDTEFTYPYYPVPVIPGGIMSVKITFYDGVKESIGRVGPPTPFIEFTEHQDPKAGIRRNVDGTFNFLLSVEKESISPLKQHQNGILNTYVQCRDNLTLIIKEHRRIPACVTESTKQKLIERGWMNNDIDMLSSKYTGISNLEKLLVENKIDYLKDKLVVTSGIHLRGDPGCGAVVDTDFETHWFGIDSISNPAKITMYSENPQQCIVNTVSCFCNAQMELASLTLDELGYFTQKEQEEYADILIDYLYEENINRTPKFMIGKHNVGYTDPSAIGYCGKIWGTNTYGYFDGAIVNGKVEDYGISKELPLLCAISNDSQYFGKMFVEKENA